MLLTWLEPLRQIAPPWLTSAGVIVLVALVALLLRGANRRLLRTRNGAFRPLRELARAVHLPLLALLWTLGGALGLFVVLPPEARIPRLLLYLTTMALGAALLVWLVVRCGRRLIVALDRWGEARHSLFERYLVPLMARAGAVLAPIFVLLAVIPLLEVSPELAHGFRNLTALILIGGIAALLIHVVNLGERLLMERFRVDVADNLRARRVHTQVAVLRKVLTFFIVLLALASMLMVFDKVRQLGASILASAGIAGAVLGLASQKVLGNLIAGIQIAITQPIRLDDVVVVEGEWGEVEEVTLTYVVVRIWDLRRLVLPITYFTEKPFQNWTRRSTDLLGTVYMYLDYPVPVDVLREELHRIVSASPLWDGKECSVLVTDLTERAMQVRLLVSGANGGDVFMLRAEAREKMMAFVQRSYPGALPRLRLEQESKGSVEETGPD